MSSCSPYKKVSVLEDTVTIDTELYETKTFSVVEVIDAFCEPIGGEIALKTYGVTDREAKQQLFIYGTSTVMQDNSKLIIDSAYFEAVRVLVYPGHVQALIKPFKGTLEVV